MGRTSIHQSHVPAWTCLSNEVENLQVSAPQHVFFTLFYVNRYLFFLGKDSAFHKLVIKFHSRGRTSPVGVMGTITAAGTPFSGTHLIQVTCAQKGYTGS